MLNLDPLLLETHQLGRRREHRVRIDLPVSVFGRGGRRRFRIVDLSCAGAQIEGAGDKPLPPVHTMELVMGRRRLRVLARTVWSNGSRHAVSFLAMTDVDRLTIAEMLDQLR